MGWLRYLPLISQRAWSTAPMARATTPVRTLYDMPMSQQASFQIFFGLHGVLAEEKRADFPVDKLADGETLRVAGDTGAHDTVVGLHLDHEHALHPRHFGEGE